MFQLSSLSYTQSVYPTKVGLDSNSGTLGSEFACNSPKNIAACRALLRHSNRAIHPLAYVAFSIILLNLLQKSNYLFCFSYAWIIEYDMGFPFTSYSSTEVDESEQRYLFLPSHPQASLADDDSFTFWMRFFTDSLLRIRFWVHSLSWTDFFYRPSCGGRSPGPPLKVGTGKVQVN